MDAGRIVRTQIAAIQAIIFDMGGTLRTREPDEPTQRAAFARLAELLGVDPVPEAYWQELERRHREYSKWAQKTLVERTEQEIWTHWVLPEMPCDWIEPIAPKLTLLWRQSKGRALVRPDATTTLAELTRRGYRLGLVSNTISAVDVPCTIQDQGWDKYLSVAVLSSTSGRRKPDPELFWEATRQLSTDPAHCAYVGDRKSRDVVGSRRAGFGLAILIESRAYLSEDDKKSTEQPDITIRQLSELLDLFAERTSQKINPPS